jgi:phosphoglycolate phosphatase
MRLIIFDFDGTLVDSRKLIWELHRLVFDEFGLPRPSREQSLALIGISLEKVLAQLAGPGAPIEQMTAAYGRLLPKLREDPAFADAPFAGATNLLAMLAASADTQLGIATGHVSQAIEPVLKTLCWRDYFCNLQSADRAPSKPHPGMLLQALRETGARAEDTVMIGDTVFDMEMACAAGIAAVGVAWGYHGRERLLSAGAGHVAGDMTELGQYLLGDRF